MAESKLKDSMHSTNKEVKRNEEFQVDTDKKGEIYDAVKDALTEKTSSVFKKGGYKELDTPTGEYATGKPYGFGAKEGAFKIRTAGKTKSMIEKQIVLGAKRLESQIKMSYNGNVLEIEYETPESAFFRGVDPKKGDRKSYMINKKITINSDNISDVKKEIEKMVADAAEKELSYLENTKLGVEDKVDAGTTSTVEEGININMQMERFTLKELFEDKDAIESLPQDEMNPEAVIDLNTQDIDGDKSLKMLFDDEEEIEDSCENKDNVIIDDLEGIYEKYNHVNKDKITKVIFEMSKQKFGTSNVEELTPVEKKDLFYEIDNKFLSELTTTGPAIAGSEGGFKDGANSGSGGYNSVDILPADDKKVSKKKKTKQTDAEKAGKPYDIPAGDDIYEGSLNESKYNKNISRMRNDSFEKTPYAKAKRNFRPRVDENYNIISESKKKDSFWTPVEIDPNYHPLGMPFVKPNSKEEWERTAHADGKGRDHDKLKRIGLEESEAEKLERLRKRKFFSEAENKVKGVNKKYILSEKTSSEYEKERWERLSNHKLYETIEKEIEISEYNKADYIQESVEKQKIDKKEEKSILEEQTILVEKPESHFGLCYKFYKKDFMNENKRYILDLNSRVFVKNPNVK